MTLTICILAKDGVVIASDSRASSTLTSNDTVKKIFKLEDHIAVGIAGDGPLATHLFDLILPKLNYRTGITDIAEQLRKECKEKFNEYFDHLKPEDRPSLSILLAGYSQTNNPEIYFLRSNDNFVPRKSPTGFECIGIPYIAEYLLNRIYGKEITVSQATTMAAFCIKETGYQDYRVGGPTQIATFSNSKAYSELSRLEIDTIEKNCESLLKCYKANFYPEDTTGPSSSEDATKS